MDLFPNLPKHREMQVESEVQRVMLYKALKVLKDDVDIYRGRPGLEWVE